MPSNKLSPRRGTARKPPICIAPKIPIIIPPPPAWPPATIDLNFKFTFNWEEGPITHEWDMTLDWYVETETWNGVYSNTDNHQAEWYTICPTPSGAMYISGWADPFGEYACYTDSQPVTCGSSNPVEITDWDDYSGGMYDIIASFQF